MFVYFPEYFYKNSKEYFKSTFRNEISDKDKINNILFNNDTILEISKNFKNNKLSLPIIEFKHCNKFLVNKNNATKAISNYDLVENKISICKNQVSNYENLSNLVTKELTYAQEYNITYKNKNLSINDLAKITVNACKSCVNENNKILKTELIKRCSSMEFKSKYNKKILDAYENEIENSDLKMNEIVKKIIELNIN